MNIGAANLGCTIDGALTSAQTRDESFLVQVPPSGARITAVQGSGWMLNPRGDNQVDIHTNRPALPIAVRPGDSLVVARVKVAGEPNTYWSGSPWRSPVAEMVAICFVPYAVG